MRFRFIKQHDAMQCGIASLAMVCSHFGKQYSMEYLSRVCYATHEGVSLLGITQAAQKLGLESLSTKTTVEGILQAPLPCILHWNQNHFVVLYKIRRGKTFYIADPGKGKIKYTKEEFKSHWISTTSQGEEKGVAMFLEPTPEFGKLEGDEAEGIHSFRFLMGYLKQYRRYFVQIALGLFVGSLLQLILPFLTQAIVDLGIKHRDIQLIWLILLGELMIVIGRTSTDFIRRWLLLHISMRINISLVSDFFIKLLKLPMSFFDTKLMGDLLQRMSDHSRVQSFLTNQTLSVMFTTLSFLIFGIILAYYDISIFAVFLAGSALYGIWIATFLQRRKVLDYELFEKQAINQNKTYQFITSMQEIKLQDCEQRRRWEWEDVQADLADAGGGKHLHQRSEEHRDYRAGGNRRHPRADDIGYDAGGAIHHRAAELARRAADEFYLFATGREDILGAHQRGAQGKRRGKREGVENRIPFGRPVDRNRRHRFQVRPPCLAEYIGGHFLPHPFRKGDGYCRGFGQRKDYLSETDVRILSRSEGTDYDRRSGHSGI